VDLAGFTLRCMVCNKGLNGQKEAQEHAMATRHQNFAQF
jgi:ubiquitin thioesterase OTU1